MYYMMYVHIVQVYYDLICVLQLAIINIIYFIDIFPTYLQRCNIYIGNWKKIFLKYCLSKSRVKDQSS